MSLDVERVNGNVFCWPSAIWSVNGEQLFGCTGLTYAWKRERTYGYGMGRSHAPRAMSKGKVNFELSKFKMYKDSVDALREYYARFASDGSSFCEPKLNHSFQFIEDGTLKNRRIDLFDVAFVGETGQHDENPDPLMVDIEMQYMRILFDGKFTPWDNRSSNFML